jgi:hypothetical protein
MAEMGTAEDLDLFWLGDVALAYQADGATKAFKDAMKAKLLGQSNERSNHGTGTPRD